MGGFYDQCEVDPEDLDDGFTVVTGDDTAYVFDDAEAWLARQDVPDWVEYMPEQDDLDCMFTSVWCDDTWVEVAA